MPSTSRHSSIGQIDSMCPTLMRRGRPCCPPRSPCTPPTSSSAIRTPPTRSCARRAPVCWNDVTNFWALLKYEDIRYVSSNPALFSSTKGITIPDPVLPNPVQEGNLIFTDPPRHRQLRKLINTGFTRRQVADPRAEDPRDRLRDPRRRRVRLHPRVRRRDRRSAAHPDDRRAARCAARRLGAVPPVVGRVHRKRRPRDRAGLVRGHRRAVRVLPAADRRPARRTAQRHAVGVWPPPRSTAPGSPTKTC